ncbi:putative FAD-linked oxidoreductase [Cladobotryum mycophilum]|uniref:FAD-linked oxidoreductase n=1 Tax=Cladobotryum mycophilum TaxID=491253 RepID=A0ABR0SN40_9HYPO
MRQNAAALWAIACLTGALANPSASTAIACKGISKVIPNRVWYPLSIPYISETNAYWSVALKEIKPACLVLPKSAEDVAAAVRVLNQHPDVLYAVKSGGHDPNPRHSTIQGGVVISMRDLNGVAYDPRTKLAYVKPGGTWYDVISTLEPYGVAILGGRIGIVGVGGLLLQGGLSFLSAQYGLAADNIVGWETVTANGSIVNIDAAIDKELAVAMRGSGSQFGIVTKFTIRAYPIGKVWGGYRIYTEASADKIFEAVHEFIPNNAADPKAALIVSQLVLFGGIRSFVIFYFYQDGKPPVSGPLAKFLQIQPLIDQTSTQTYSSLLKKNGDLPGVVNARIAFSTLTIPYIPDNPQIYAEIADHFTSLYRGFLLNPLHLTSLCSIDFLPLPAVIAKHSEERGGNALGIKEADGDRLMIETQCTWAFKNDDSIIHELTNAMLTWLNMKIGQWIAKEDSLANYLPIMMNVADANQNVTGSYRDYASFKSLQQAIDPEGFFRQRGGGFKF